MDNYNNLRDITWYKFIKQFNDIIIHQNMYTKYQISFLLVIHIDF